MRFVPSARRPEQEAGEQHCNAFPTEDLGVVLGTGASGAVGEMVVSERVGDRQGATGGQNRGGG